MSITSAHILVDVSLLVLVFVFIWCHFLEIHIDLLKLCFCYRILHSVGCVRFFLIILRGHPRYYIRYQYFEAALCLKRYSNNNIKSALTSKQNPTRTDGPVYKRGPNRKRVTSVYFMFQLETLKQKKESEAITDLKMMDVKSVLVKET